ncbi:MAG: substrate-binding domain-containing protein [Phycisphaeraceae bacterium]|nr:substrate-binding domain-containing protein [Phycisphaeraceae bacterium]
MAPKPRRIALMLDLDHPYQRHLGIFAGTQRYAEQHHWECTIDEFVDHTLSRHKGRPPYDGVIARTTTKLARLCRQKNIPLVNVWGNSPAAQSVQSVLPDTEAAGRMAADHLMSRGLRRFATLVSRSSRLSYSSGRAFVEAIEEANHTCLMVRVPNTPSESLSNWQNAERSMSQWMDKWSLPIGVYVGGDSPSRLVAQVCRHRNWRVPEDVAIIAGSDEPLVCEYPPPSITSLKLGYDRIGFEAARQLEELMNQTKQQRSRRTTAPDPILVPPQGLAVRQSTDFYAAEDPQVAAALRFIGENCHKPIDVEQVAQTVATSGRTLQKRFRKSIGRTVAGEIRRVRIDRVKRELAESNRTLADIAADVGFRNPQRLCNVFQREVGISPGNYRKQWKET